MKKENNKKSRWPLIIAIILIGVFVYIYFIVTTNNKEKECRDKARSESILIIMNEKPFEPNVEIRESNEKTLEFQLTLKCFKQNGIR